MSFTIDSQINLKWLDFNFVLVFSFLKEFFGWNWQSLLRNSKKKCERERKSLIITWRQGKQDGAAKIHEGEPNGNNVKERHRNKKEMNHIWSHKYKPYGLNAMNIFDFSPIPPVNLANCSAVSGSLLRQVNWCSLSHCHSLICVLWVHCVCVFVASLLPGSWRHCWLSKPISLTPWKNPGSHKWQQNLSVSVKWEGDSFKCVGEGSHTVCFLTHWE